MEDAKQKPALMKIDELAECTGLGLNFIRKSMRYRSLPYYKLGKSVRYKLPEVMEWIEKCRHEGEVQKIEDQKKN